MKCVKFSCLTLIFLQTRRDFSFCCASIFEQSLRQYTLIHLLLNSLKAKEKYRGVFEIQKSGDKTRQMSMICII